MMKYIDMSVRENLAKAISLAEAASDPDGFGPIDTAMAIGIMVKTDTVECTYVDDEDGVRVSAITGNGPRSKANAEFYASVRKVIAGLVM